MEVNVQGRHIEALHKFFEEPDLVEIFDYQKVHTTYSEQEMA
jgi:hypothetical protein